MIESGAFEGVRGGTGWSVRRFESAKQDAAGAEHRTVGHQLTEEAELVFLEAYLPAQLSDPELEALVAQAVSETGASGMPQMGLVMKAATALVAGRAEGGRVAAMVRSALAGS